MQQTSRLLSWLVAGAPPSSSPARVAVVAAHPDDETIGLGGQLARLHGSVIHLSDGAPRQRRWWGASSFPSREAYARARRRELIAALSLAGVGEDRLTSLGVPDQETYLHLAGLTLRLADLIARLQLDLVFTHAYEGGHPDHDTAAFVVHAACEIRGRYGPAPEVVEFTSYHIRPDGGVATGEFLPAEGVEEVRVPLSKPKRERKRAMLGAFRTQRKTLSRFGVEVERFRTAPHYDFTSPPHRGTLYYELFDWGCSGAQWRIRAQEASWALGFPMGVVCSPS